jgi:hypothetical protein
MKKTEEAYNFDHGFPHTFPNGYVCDHSNSMIGNAPGDVLKGNGRVWSKIKIHET